MDDPDKRNKRSFKGDLSKYAEKAENMATSVRAKGCERETALELSLLALYDVVLLIDNSISMEVQQDGERIKTLMTTLQRVAWTYSFVSEVGGIVSIKYLNQKKGDRKVKAGHVANIIKSLRFQGLTPLGTELRNKVLKEYADPDKMRRPLLVVVITDGEIEGEPDGLLQKVIMNKALDLRDVWGDEGPEAVAYQFATIGNDKGARDLVQKLDDDPQLGDYIDCMLNETLDNIGTEQMWTILPKLLLGAISPYWDEKETIEDEEDFKDGVLADREVDTDVDREAEGDGESFDF